MFRQGDVISYLEMCQEEGVNLQRGMNFRLRGNLSVILMSTRPGAPYEDHVENDGKVLIYEGHDIANKKGSPDPKMADQPFRNSNGTLTQNGLFYEAAKKSKKGDMHPQKVRVYEKIRSGIWVFNGVFHLVDAWEEPREGRKVFKFRLELSEDPVRSRPLEFQKSDQVRLIPTSVKLEVWKRDKGKCRKCGSKDNLHFDHIIPYSKGGSSLVPDNIQILCARHNLAKRDKIE